MELSGSYIEPSEDIRIFAYREASGIVPRGSNVYGSALQKVRLQQDENLSMHYNIKRKEIKVAIQ